MITPSPPTFPDWPGAVRNLHRVVCLLGATVMLGASPALAQGAGGGKPGVITGGSGDVMVGGKPAARAGDVTTEGAIIDGSSNVFINGKPAAIGGSRTGCGGVLTGSGSGVFINGKPVARSGDPSTGCR
ncbi:PAAR domain-containing protein [Rhodopseudomonas palustris]|uniref:PAAR domain-containing protein n=1 Tax=Rhodopseudomonas palustris TaxID=1076 RepID=UPI00069A6FB9|nr:PAAR domain-containing protein [Rhodopseudomonas palustris]